MRLYGLIGFPIAHSFSAKYFEKKFAKEKITDAFYRLFPLPDISQLPELLIQHPDLEGFNITIPHKVAILPLIRNISKEAEGVGAINCVKVIRNSSGITLHGFNTDVYGFRESLLPQLEPWHRKALVLGTGGASKAVSYVLTESGISYTLVSRTNKKDFRMHYSQLTEKEMSDNLLIINTTPLGTYPDIENCPDLPYQYLTDRHLLYDLVYNPEETLFLRKGKQAGAKTKSGIQMLELQAEKSWVIWNK